MPSSEEQRELTPPVSGFLDLQETQRREIWKLYRSLQQAEGELEVLRAINRLLSLELETYVTRQKAQIAQIAQDASQFDPEQR